MHPTTQRSADVHDWLVAHDPLPVSVLHDPTVDTCGFDARSAYVETYWLGLLGPSCVLAARRLAAWLEVEPDGFEISLVALSGTLGLGTGTERHAPAVRTLTRLVDFHIATVADTYAIRRMFPPLAARQIARLPDHLAAAHAVDRASEAMTCRSGMVGEADRTGRRCGATTPPPCTGTFSSVQTLRADLACRPCVQTSVEVCTRRSGDR